MCLKLFIYSSVCYILFLGICSLIFDYWNSFVVNKNVKENAKEIFKDPEQVKCKDLIRAFTNRPNWLFVLNPAIFNGLITGLVVIIILRLCKTKLSSKECIFIFLVISIPTFICVLLSFSFKLFSVLNPGYKFNDIWNLNFKGALFGLEKKSLDIFEDPEQVKCKNLIMHFTSISYWHWMFKTCLMLSFSIMIFLHMYLKYKNISIDKTTYFVIFMCNIYFSYLMTEKSVSYMFFHGLNPAYLMCNYYT